MLRYLYCATKFCKAKVHVEETVDGLTCRPYGSEHNHDPLHQTEWRLNASVKAQIAEQTKLGASAFKIYSNFVANSKNPLDSSKIPTQRQVEYHRSKYLHRNELFDTDFINIIHQFGHYTAHIELWTQFHAAPLLILTTPDLVELLVEHGDTIFFNGTHSLVAHQTQVIVLLIKGPHGKALPVCMALAPSHDVHTYETMLRVLDSRAGHRWQPRIAMMDFELAIAQAFRFVFNGIRIAGCGFHFMQAIRRYLRSHKASKATEAALMQEVKELYWQKDETSFFTKGVELIEKWKKSGPTADFANYFQNSWLGGGKRAPLHPPAIWAAWALDDDKTNNFAESFMGTFKDLVGTLHLGLFRACEEVVHLLDFSLNEFRRAQSGLAKRKRSTKPKNNILSTLAALKSKTNKKQHSTNPTSDPISTPAQPGPFQLIPTTKPTKLIFSNKPQSIVNTTSVTTPPPTAKATSPPTTTATSTISTIAPSAASSSTNAEKPHPMNLAPLQNVPAKMSYRGKHFFSSQACLERLLAPLSLCLIDPHAASGQCAFAMYCLISHISPLPENLMIMRHNLVEIIQANKPFFKNIVSGSLQARCSNLLTKPYELAGWGDTDTHQAFAMWAGANFILLVANTTGDDIIRIPFSSDPSSSHQNNCDVGYVGAYLNLNHYVAVGFKNN